MSMTTKITKHGMLQYAPKTFIASSCPFLQLYDFPELYLHISRFEIRYWVHILDDSFLSLLCDKWHIHSRFQDYLTDMRAHSSCIEVLNSRLLSLSYCLLTPQGSCMLHKTCILTTPRVCITITRELACGTVHDWSHSAVDSTLSDDNVLGVAEAVLARVLQPQCFPRFLPNVASSSPYPSTSASSNSILSWTGPAALLYEMSVEVLLQQDLLREFCSHCVLHFRQLVRGQVWDALGTSFDSSLRVLDDSLLMMHKLTGDSQQAVDALLLRRHFSGAASSTAASVVASTAAFVPTSSLSSVTMAAALEDLYSYYETLVSSQLKDMRLVHEGGVISHDFFLTCFVLWCVQTSCI